jgi:HSP20 family protein
MYKSDDVRFPFQQTFSLNANTNFIEMSSVFYYEPFYDFDRLVDEVLSSGRTRNVQKDNRDGAVRCLKPRMDLHENNQRNRVTATFDFPGLSKENIQIDLHNGKLTVSAETKQSEEHDETGYAVRERRYGKYSRTLQIPQGIKEEEIKASMENGVLTIIFPKSTAELAPKRITIS